MHTYINAPAYIFHRSFMLLWRWYLSGSLCHLSSVTITITWSTDHLHLPFSNQVTFKSTLHSMIVRSTVHYPESHPTPYLLLTCCCLTASILLRDLMILHSTCSSPGWTLHICTQYHCTHTSPSWQVSCAWDRCYCQNSLSQLGPVHLGFMPNHQASFSINAVSYYSDVQIYMHMLSSILASLSRNESLSECRCTLSIATWTV